MGPGIITEDNEITIVVKNKGNEYAGNLRLRTLFLGDKTADEVLSNLPPVSELEKGKKVGGYFKKESTDSLLIPYTNSGGSKGNYLLLLYEDQSDVLLATSTAAFDKDYEYEFVDLEVVSYKLDVIGDPDDPQLGISITLKNNDTKNNWPKYSGNKDALHIEFLDPNTGASGNFNFENNIGKGKELNIYHEYILFSVPETIFLFVEERLRDGQVKRIFEKTIKIGETDPTGISTVPTSDNSSSTFFNLKGQPSNGTPTQKGIYINQNRKIIIK